MRIHSYRAWDEKAKKMNYKVMVGNTDENDKNYTSSIIWNGHDWVHFDSGSGIHVMQYTGLRDKNGVKIFEGDVVAIENHPFQKTDVSDVGMEINGNYEVGWNADDLTWCAGSLLLARVKNYVRVVGNIYENSDLLEE